MLVKNAFWVYLSHALQKKAGFFMPVHEDELMFRIGWEILMGTMSHPVQSPAKFFIKPASLSLKRRLSTFLLQRYNRGITKQVLRNTMAFSKNRPIAASLAGKMKE
jgi:hypothetical protein